MGRGDNALLDKGVYHAVVFGLILDRQFVCVQAIDVDGAYGDGTAIVWLQTQR